MCQTGRYDFGGSLTSSCLPDGLERHVAEYSAKVELFRKGALTADEFKAARVTNGIYEQRQDATFMMRVRIVAGTVTPSQLRCISQLADEFRGGHLHLTTRQNIQIHGIRIEDSPEIMRRLADAGLGMLGGGGNAVRNISVSPFAGNCPYELFDTSPFACALTKFLLEQPGSLSLPRKFKIAFAGSMADFELVSFADLGFLAEIREGKPGFKLYAGGGLGAKSRLADLLLDWIPSGDCIRAAEAARRLFDKYGDRQNRAAARLRFVFERIPLDEIRRIFLDLFNATAAEGLPQTSFSPELRAPRPHGTELRQLPESLDGLACWPERNDGLVSARIPLPMGLVSPADIKKLAEAAELFSLGRNLRTSHSQDFIMPNVERGRIPELRKSIEKMEIGRHLQSSLPSIVSCSGASVCRLGICRSRELAVECAAALDRAGIRSPILSGLDIRISGCPNNCGQHSVAMIGFSGVAKTIQGRRAYFYRILIRFPGDDGRAGLSTEVECIPARAVPSFLAELLISFGEQGKGGETFPAFASRKGQKYFADLAARHRDVPGSDSDSRLYDDWGQ